MGHAAQRHLAAFRQAEVWAHRSKGHQPPRGRGNESLPGGVTMILVPSTGRDDWRRLLAKPELHWKPGKSAFECATAWEAARQTARGLPSNIAAALDSDPSTAQAQALVVIPELQVDLPPGGHASQNDVWALLRTTDG